MGTVDPDTADLLRAMVRARMSIVVSGGTSSGKTTLLNALSGFIPPEERIVTIEDSAELQLQQPHVISLEARPPNVEGKGQVTIRDLVRNSLRMRPDRIVVGEVRGPETIDMLQAMNTGHDGSLTTVHANSAEDSIVRMQTLASMSEVDVPFTALRDQINSAIDVIVQLERGADGSPPDHRGRRGVLAAARGVPPGDDHALRGRRGRRRPQRHRHVGALPAARRRRRPPARARRDRARRLHHRGGRRARDARAQGGRVSSDSTALLLTAGTLVVATAGAWDLLAAGASREELRERATGRRAEPRLARLDARLGAAFERTAPGRAPAAAPRRRRAADPRAARGAVALAGALAGYLLAGLLVGRLASFVAGALVVVGLSMWLERKREARRDEFMGQLPELARILSNGASAGLSMVSAYGVAVQELDDPARTELRIALEEIRIGQSFEGAMASLGERMPSRELAVLVSTLAIQQRSGGDLVRALSDMATTLEARRETQREVKTLMAGATATSYVVMVIGAAALFLSDLIRPGTLDKVASSPIGLLALFVAGVLFVVGFLLIKRITRIDT